MTRSLYIIGGPGSGKSTLMGQLLPYPLSPFETLWSLRNAKNIVGLSGHRLIDDGLYLGRMRDVHPGTDGLDRATSPVLEDWLLSAPELPRYIMGEGATLCTRRALTALHEQTDLLTVHLWCPLELLQNRFLQRGTHQDPRFVLAGATRANNMAGYLRELGSTVLSFDTSDPIHCDLASARSRQHLELS